MTIKSITLLALAATLLAVVPASAESKKFGLGREATVNEVKAWDIDVRPDGQGLPVGKGSVEEGEAVFAEQCASCHGDFAEGVDRWPVLAGGMGSITTEDPVKTVGSYWPYLSTAYDYIYRAMPFGNAQSLEPDQMYGIIAYILNMSGIVPDDFVLSNENFTSVRMPNEANFFDDPRPDGKNVNKDGEPCMKDCKTDVQITMRARILDVTPKEGEEQPTGKLD